jgi:RNA polymerase-binding transcription factor DksA
VWKLRNSRNSCGNSENICTDSVHVSFFFGSLTVVSTIVHGERQHHGPDAARATRLHELARRQRVSPTGSDAARGSQRSLAANAGVFTSYLRAARRASQAGHRTRRGMAKLCVATVCRMLVSGQDGVEQLPALQHGAGAGGGRWYPQARLAALPEALLCLPREVRHPPASSLFVMLTVAAVRLRWLHVFAARRQQSRCLFDGTTALIHRSDWDVCPGCGTDVPVSTLDVLDDWDVCRQCLRALVRSSWHVCPGKRRMT